jgi:hypothetical protein
VEEDGQRYYTNPAQPNTSCNDVAPDDRYSCEQQVSHQHIQIITPALREFPLLLLLGSIISCIYSFQMSA